MNRRYVVTKGVLWKVIEVTDGSQSTTDVAMTRDEAGALRIASALNADLVCAACSKELTS